MNSSRTRTHNQPPIPFLLSDISPHLDAWVDLSASSDNLSFIPQPVDATAPPPSVISVTAPVTRGTDEGADAGAGTTRTGAAQARPQAISDVDSGRKIFRLFSLSFHHFDDVLAAKVLRSSLETADGFAIIELQDRRAWSLLLMLLDFPLLMLVTLFWRWRDPLHLIFTYAIPVLPLVQMFDGLVSCLRTREFDELLALMGKSNDDGRKDDVRVHRLEGKCAEVSISGARWIVTGGSQMHTWPVGYMHWFVGRKVAR